MLNEYLIQKLGWIQFRRDCLSYNLNIPFQDDKNVLFYYHQEKEKIIFVIKHIKVGEYKFVYCDYKTNGNYHFESHSFKTTYDFLLLVNKFQCCNLKYQRFLKINTILK